MLRMISWNVDSLNAALTLASPRAQLSRDVLRTIQSADADFIAIQETKLSAKGPEKKDGINAEKIVPRIGAPDPMDDEGRLLVLESENFYFVNVYTPNAGDGLKRLSERQVWDKLYADYLAELDSKKPVIACGDFNVAHKEIDLAHPETNHMSAGFTDEEREGFTNLLNRGFVDTFRYVHGDVPNVYSWWAQRVRTSKINNSGWRIDYFLVSDRIKDKVVRSEMIDSGPRQDHAPILLEIEI